MRVSCITSSGTTHKRRWRRLALRMKANSQRREDSHPQTQQKKIPQRRTHRCMLILRKPNSDGDLQNPSTLEGNGVLTLEQCRANRCGRQKSTLFLSGMTSSPGSSHQRCLWEHAVAGTQRFYPTTNRNKSPSYIKDCDCFFISAAAYLNCMS
uniref:Uncharacterized protein n=2 Tax=Ornithodoros erraticus TaxID=265619 RepID=A0A293LGY7_ORNER